jgi:hypothetical protein
MVGKLSIPLQCICDVPAWNTGICPQCYTGGVFPEPSAIQERIISPDWPFDSVGRSCSEHAGEVTVRLNPMDWDWEEAATIGMSAKASGSSGLWEGVVQYL